MFFAKRLCNIRACEKRFLFYFKREQCDLNYVVKKIVTN